MLDALLSLGAASSGVNSVFEMCKNVSGVFKGNQKDLYLNYLDSFDKSFKKISQNIERVSDKILIAPNLEIVQDVNKTRQQKIEDLKEARESLEPIQRALDTEILSSAMILTPEKMQAALAKNPWLVLLDVRPISRVTSPNNPDLVPVVFHDNGMQYVGWQMRGTLPILFDCKFDELLIPKPVAEIFEENELEQFQERLFNRSQNKSTKSNKFEKDKGKPFQFEVVTITNVTNGGIFGIGKKVITSKKQHQAYCKTEALGKGVNLEMVYIPSGTFKMGSNEENREKPIHSVTVPEFYMSKYPITQKQYQTIMGEDPARFKGENHPVERVSWDNAVAFCKKLSEKTG
ncbi:MAG: formylglycine-generating enzyme family protein, partial [Thiomargarita sp.]|nr:formylglycine-generating enzyme family protein [Thiomargarita sp.]